MPVIPFVIQQNDSTNDKFSLYSSEQILLSGKVIRPVKIGSFYCISLICDDFFRKLLILNDTAVASEKNEHTYKPQLGAIDS